MILIVTLTNGSVNKIMEVKWQDVRPGKIRNKREEKGKGQVAEVRARARGVTENRQECDRVTAAVDSSL